jgi:hypothetical protein
MNLNVTGEQVDLKENAVKTKHIFMSHHQNAGHHYNVKAVNKSSETSVSSNVLEQQ